MLKKQLSELELLEEDRSTTHSQASSVGYTRTESLDPPVHTQRRSPDARVLLPSPPGVTLTGSSLSPQQVPRRKRSTSLIPSNDMIGVASPTLKAHLLVDKISLPPGNDAHADVHAPLERVVLSVPKARNKDPHTRKSVHGHNRRYQRLRLRRRPDSQSSSLNKPHSIFFHPILTFVPLVRPTACWLVLPDTRLTWDLNRGTAKRILVMIQDW